MGLAEVISLSEVRASSQWQRLRDDLHIRFDQWLDRLQATVPGEPLSDVISICYILGFRKDNAKFFNKLSLNRWHF